MAFTLEGGAMGMVWELGMENGIGTMEHGIMDGLMGMI